MGIPYALWGLGLDQPRHGPSGWETKIFFFGSKKTQIQRANRACRGPASRQGCAIVFERSEKFRAAYETLEISGTRRVPAPSALKWALFRKVFPCLGSLAEGQWARAPESVFFAKRKNTILSAPSSYHFFGVFRRKTRF